MGQRQAAAPAEKASRRLPPPGPGLRRVDRSIAARLRAGDSGTDSLPLLPLDATLPGSSCESDREET